MTTQIQQNSQGFPLPDRFVESVLIRDGATKISEPSKYPTQPTVVVIQGEFRDLVFYIQKPKDYHLLKQVTLPKAWFIYPKVVEIVEKLNTW